MLSSYPAALVRFVALFSVLYAGFGVVSPFLPAFLQARGLPPTQVGLVLAMGTAIRMLSAPLAGRIGDLLQDLRRVLVICVAVAAVVTLAYLGAHGLVGVLLVTLLYQLAVAPTFILADALALSAASRNSTAREPSDPAFEYAWVRGAGSAAFIVGTLAAGQLIDGFGLPAIVVAQSLLLGGATVAAARVPRPAPAPTAPVVRAPAAGVLVLLRNRPFLLLVLAAAMISGSHAMQDAFAVIRWRAAGMSSSLASVLWSESVAAEVVVFFLVGPKWLRRLTPTGAMAVAAVAAALRWFVMATTTDTLALSAIQPLHGITFALLHLACMRVIADVVPHGLEGTAQALYGTVGLGSASALLSLASGWLYAELGAWGFGVMAVLCLFALPVIWRLRVSLAASRVVCAEASPA